MSHPQPGEPPRQPRLLDRLREQVRVRGYSLSTEEAYVGWARRFILFHQKRHPLALGKEEVSAFLSHLATVRDVSPSTQNQALAAILFLYQRVLQVELPWLNDVVRAKRGKRLPVLLTREEVAAVLTHLQGMPHLMATLLYGAGLRLLECLRLRIKDLDFDRGEITVREGKGNRDRVTMLPRRAVQALRGHLAGTRALFEEDRSQGRPGVSLPDALARKYPAASREWAWWYAARGHR
jgi:integron integrase